MPAVLLATAPTYDYTGYQPEVRARWIAPDGARRTGTVPAQPGQRAGSTVMVWADAAGRLTGPPLQAQQVRGQAFLAAVLAPVLLSEMLLAAGQLAHFLLGRGGGWPPGTPNGGPPGPTSGEVDHPSGDVGSVVGQTLVKARHQRQLHRHRKCHLS